MKNLVIFSDGTGNSSAKAQKTNVWRMFKALDQTSSSQLAIYDDGVGTSSVKFLAAIGGAFGWGLKRNVIDLYKFVCRNYVDGDQIYGFGFSRGAFTIRVLVGMIANQGLVGFRSEDELHHFATAAYRRYRAERFRSPNRIVNLNVTALRWVRDRVIALVDWLAGHGRKSAPKNIADRDSVPIKFLGLWDTVEAYGMPIVELKRGIDCWLWPMIFTDTALYSRVERACHALSLDDERTTFHPVLWDEERESRMIAACKPGADGKPLRAGRLSQVWFAGVHSNVGGGYPEDQLSFVSLEWMMHEAMNSELHLDPKAVEEIAATKSPYARLYDSRAGAGAAYRYEPRRVSNPLVHKLLDVNGNEILPIVDHSVIERIAFGSDYYAPISLPHQFWVLAPGGDLVAIQGPGTPVKQDQTKSPVASAARAKKLPQRIADERTRLDEAMSILGHTDLEAIRLVWDTVWWRRILYFFNIAFAAIVVTFPWLGATHAAFIRRVLTSLPVFGPSLNALYQQDVGKVNQSAGGVISTLVDAAAGLIPSYLSSWTDALIRYPVEFGSAVIGILVCLAASRTLQSQIRDRARLAWLGNRQADYLRWSRDRGYGARNKAALGFLIGLALVLAAWWLGWKSPLPLEFLVLTLIFLVFLVWRWMHARNLNAVVAARKVSLPSTAALSLARQLRDNPALRKLNQVIARAVIPFVFACAIVVAALAVANRVAFDVASSAGAYCEGSVNPQQILDKPATATGFITDNMCWPTGLVLRADRSYRITLDASAGDWFDKSVRTDPGGFAAPGWVHVIATPLKRWWRESWFQPIARIGVLGNDEYVLKPNVPLAPPAYPKGCTTDKDMGGGSFVPISDGAARDLMACAPVPSERLMFTTVIKASSTGELFIFVNDAVLALPKGRQFFYRNNRGTATITVEQVEP